MSKKWQWRGVLVVTWIIQALVYLLTDSSVWVVIGIGAVLGVSYMIFDATTSRNERGRSEI
jgi:hypothetical protein